MAEHHDHRVTEAPAGVEPGADERGADPEALPVGLTARARAPRCDVPGAVGERRQAERDVAAHPAALDGDERNAERRVLAQRVDNSPFIGPAEGRRIDPADGFDVRGRLGPDLHRARHRLETAGDGVTDRASMRAGGRRR